ncbi:ABC transporter ATP-binding protein [Pengzhenrongella frigida]|uniref:ATP-binding cassette domain-containing protein n=1 Tax=Pengzhenrongella frigida TaxID=1259133 RepID=A0A4Q5MZ90_9MICO|nr:ATP-binding cassette domain-containing protein [Cellulomonas sp. HLT2-17]
MAVISARGLTKTFGEVKAVSELTFEVAEGRITGFLGPNGAGKTTTLRMLLGLIRPTSGTALIDGRPYRELTQPRRVVGAMLDADSFHPGRTGRNHLRVLAGTTGVPPARIDVVLDQVSLTRDAGRRVHGYSVGMRQRLGLASALLGDPAVLILDEPTNGLDPAGVAWLRTLLRNLASEGRTVLVSSHALAEVAATVDDVVIISGGQLQYSGPLSDLSHARTTLEDSFLRLTGSAS